MSLPNHIFATTEPSETLQTTLESQKMTLDWPSSASIAPELPSNRTQEHDFSISSSHYPQTTTDLQQLHQEPCATEMELHPVDYATGNEDFLYPVTSQIEPDLLDPWIPNFHGEPSIYPTGTISQGQYNIEQILPWNNTLGEEICDFDNLIPIQFPQPQLVGIQGSTEQNLDEHQAIEYASSMSTSSAESLETIKDHSQTKKNTNIARGNLIDEVLRTLRQMDHQIRAMHRKHLADIVRSNTI
ncbi:hypothetical protein T069G_00100 [Trichoderma breve]|uniref:Uncharacterized protein n=1 Tax=Trichoderma breve TaxID=2034170 RepID=A0A9W9EBB8_9HYPO|nr:hypothetical protein T069G_00100 [Trichoderma breve]KAJ4863570.1 hypothetical protein T069G_00100 [Trichoderma breve]